MTQLLAHLFGDYILQSDWMAQSKTKRSWPAFAHALLYSLCFVPLCWVAAQHIPVTIVTTVSGCPLTEPTTALFTCSTLMVNTASGFLPAAAAKTIPSTVIPANFRWLPWLVIFSTHFLIDRFRLARYVVWAKNWLGPRNIHWCDYGCEQPTCGSCRKVRTLPLLACPTGYPPTTPIWLSTWLLIIADNTLHLAINYAALRLL